MKYKNINSMSGYNTDRFVNLNEWERDELTCSSCQNILNSPVVTQCCLEMYCRHCIQAVIKSNYKCPNDDKPMTIWQLTPPPR